MSLVTGSPHRSVKGIQDYFSPLMKFLQSENIRFGEIPGWNKEFPAERHYLMTPILVGVISLVLTVLFLLLIIMGRKHHGKVCCYEGEKVPTEEERDDDEKHNKDVVDIIIEHHA